MESKNDWQNELAAGLNSEQALCDYLGLALPSESYSGEFAVRVPRIFADQIKRGDLNDPILKQVLPERQENQQMPGFINDPVGDLPAMQQTGVIHKYEGRALLITTGSCAVNCRYCFRRNFPYAQAQISRSKLDAALAYLKNQPQISEIILSGGDPLLLHDEKLAHILFALAELKQIKRLRIHTRIPVVLPSRITQTFAKLLSDLPLKVIMVLHSNHENELYMQVEQACQRLNDYHIPLLNQSVLLKGVNDNVPSLVALSERLSELNIMPYYLHMLDKATGTGHFQVEQDAALEIMQQLKASLPGYLVPKLARDEAGAASKTILA